MTLHAECRETPNRPFASRFTSTFLRLILAVWQNARRECRRECRAKCRAILINRTSRCVSRSISVGSAVCRAIINLIFGSYVLVPSDREIWEEEEARSGIRRRRNNYRWVNRSLFIVWIFSYWSSIMSVFKKFRSLYNFSFKYSYTEQHGGIVCFIEC